MLILAKLSIAVMGFGLLGIGWGAFFDKVEVVRRCVAIALTGSTFCMIVMLLCLFIR